MFVICTNAASAGPALFVVCPAHSRIISPLTPVIITVESLDTFLITTSERPHTEKSCIKLEERSHVALGHFHLKETCLWKLILNLGKLVYY